MEIHYKQFKLLFLLKAKLVSSYPSTDGRLTIWHLLTLPEGMLSRRKAEATPGIRFDVLNNGRCSRGVLAVLDSRSIEEYIGVGDSFSCGISRSCAI